MKAEGRPQGSDTPPMAMKLCLEVKAEGEMRFGDRIVVRLNQ